MKLTPSEQITFQTDDYEDCKRTSDNAYWARQFMTEAKEKLSDLSEVLKSGETSLQDMIGLHCDIDLSHILSEAEDGKISLALLLWILSKEFGYQADRLKDLEDRTEAAAEDMLKNMDPADRQEYTVCPHQPDD